MRVLIASLFVAVLAIQLPAQAQTTRRSRTTDWVLSPMRVTKLKESAYLYSSQQTTLDTMFDVIDKRVKEMTTGQKDGAFQPTNAPVFVFHGSTADRSKPFTLDVGFPVDDTAVAGGDFQIGKLEPFKAAVAVYCGPIMEIGQAYRRLYGQIIAEGYVPGDVRREHYLYWEDVESTNNVILIEIQLQD